MRYVSLVFIVFVMWWTWAVIRTPSTLSEDTHVGIQDDLKRVITDYIQDNIKDVKNLRFEKFWTQTLKGDKVKATFAYSFEDGDASSDKTARIGVEGHAILNRTHDKGSEFDVWSLDELYVLNNRVTFKEGVTIRAAATSAK
jgi:hypothetical protein